METNHYPQVSFCSYFPTHNFPPFRQYQHIPLHFFFLYLSRDLPVFTRLFLFRFRFLIYFYLFVLRSYSYSFDVPILKSPFWFLFFPFSPFLHSPIFCDSFLVITHNQLRSGARFPTFSPNSLYCLCPYT